MTTMQDNLGTSGRQAARNRWAKTAGVAVDKRDRTRKRGVRLHDAETVRRRMVAANGGLEKMPQLN